VISFTLITTTPGVFKTQLINRGMAEEITETDREGKTSKKVVGVRPGLEWVEVPNPIVTTLATGVRGEEGYVPTVMDTRRVYLVKMAHDMHDDQIKDIEQEEDGEGEARKKKKPLNERTKWGQWILANSSAATIDSADGRSWPARKVGTASWFVVSDDFGVWQ
jgi:hypothetical protein